MLSSYNPHQLSYAFTENQNELLVTFETTSQYIWNVIDPTNSIDYNNDLKMAYHYSRNICSQMTFKKQGAKGG